MPDEVSKKSLKVLDKKLQLLAEHADFHVNINSVVGGGIRSPQDALVIGKRALELGFTSTRRDHPRRRRPVAAPPGRRARSLLRDACDAEEPATRASIISRTTSRTAGKIVGAAAPARAISTFAKTAWSTTARSSAAIPAKPLPEYTLEDVRREYRTAKELRPPLHGRLCPPKRRTSTSGAASKPRPVACRRPARAEQSGAVAVGCFATVNVEFSSNYTGAIDEKLRAGEFRNADQFEKRAAASVDRVRMRRIN